MLCFLSTKDSESKRSYYASYSMIKYLQILRYSFRLSHYQPFIPFSDHINSNPLTEDDAS